MQKVKSTQGPSHQYLLQLKTLPPPSQAHLTAGPVGTVSVRSILAKSTILQLALLVYVMLVVAVHLHIWLEVQKFLS